MTTSRRDLLKSSAGAALAAGLCAVPTSREHEAHAAVPVDAAHFTITTESAYPSGEHGETTKFLLGVYVTGRDASGSVIWQAGTQIELDYDSDLKKQNKAIIDRVRIRLAESGVETTSDDRFVLLGGVAAVAP